MKVTLCPCTDRVRSGGFPPTADAKIITCRNNKQRLHSSYDLWLSDVKDNTPSLPVETISKGFIVAIICGSVRVTLCPCTDRVRSGDFPPTADVKDSTPSLPVGIICNTLYREIDMGGVEFLVHALSL